MPVVEAAPDPFDPALLGIEEICAVCRGRFGEGRFGSALDRQACLAPGGKTAGEDRYPRVSGLKQPISGHLGGFGSSGGVIDDQIGVQAGNEFRYPIKKNYFVDAGVPGPGNMAGGVIFRRHHVDDHGALVQALFQFITSYNLSHG